MWSWVLSFPRKLGGWNHMIPSITCSLQRLCFWPSGLCLSQQTSTRTFSLWHPPRPCKGNSVRASQALWTFPLSELWMRSPDLPHSLRRNTVLRCWQCQPGSTQLCCWSPTGPQRQLWRHCHFSRAGLLWFSLSENWTSSQSHGKACSPLPTIFWLDINQALRYHL